MMKLCRCSLCFECASDMATAWIKALEELVESKMFGLIPCGQGIQ